MLWRPLGTLDEALVNEIVAFIEAAEEKAKPFNRFIDLSKLDMVDLTQVRLPRRAARRLIFAKRSPVKSAFFVTSEATTITRNCTPC